MTAAPGDGWDPARYLAFGDHRRRPAADLLARVPLRAPRRITDLGCGPGNTARLLAARWPDAEAFAALTVEYAARLRAAYPPEPDGRTLLPFRRVFIVALKG